MASVCSNCGFPDQPGHICNDGSQWIGQVLDGRYLIESVLGVGGMGMVFRATQTSMGRAVAVKTLNPSLAAAPTFFERFKREAEVASRLKHPNVITVFDFGRAADGTCYFVMELLEGRSLKQLVKEEGALSIRRAVTIIEQAALGLAHAHNEACVHRDLKPHNIMVQKIDGAEFVKVLDFGLVKAMEQEEEEQLTSTGQVLGTPQYMPPEQAGGEAVDKRSDLYSLAGVLYYCLTGSSPYGANSVRKALQAALTQPVPSVASRRSGAPIPKKLEEFFRKALAREKEDRHQSCDEFIDEMYEAIEGLSDAALDALPDTATAAARDSAAGSRSGSRSSVARARGATPGSRSQKGSRPSSASASAARSASAADVSRARRATTPEIPISGSGSSSKSQSRSGSVAAKADPGAGASKSRLAFVAVPALIAIAGVTFFLLKPSAPPEPQPLAQPVPMPIRPAAQDGDSQVRMAAATTGTTSDVRPAAAVTPEPSSVVEVRLASKPEGADVYDGDTWLGQTPQTLALERGEPHTLTFKLSGHRSVTRSVDLSRLAGDATDLEVVLERAAPKVAPPPPPKKKSKAFD